MSDNQPATAPETTSLEPAPAADLPQPPAAPDAPPSTAAVVESALEQVEQNLADVSAALDKLEPATLPDSLDDAAAENAAAVPSLEEATSPSESAAAPDLSDAPETLENTTPAQSIAPSEPNPAAATNRQPGATLACRVVRPFVGMLTLMDVPFSGASHESKSIIGHIAIATMLVAVATWVLRWRGYVQ